MDAKLLFLKTLVAVLSTYKKVTSKIHNFLLVYFGFIYRPLQSKKNKITALLIIAFLATLLMIGITLKKPVPPDALVFFNEATGEELNGEVYIDDAFVGDTSGTLQEIPSLYCKGTHEVRLVSGQHTLKWISKPSDCELKKVVYTVRLLNQTSGSVTLQFKVRETQAFLEGNVLFDEQLKGFAKGELEISEPQCRDISTVKLQYIDDSGDERFIEWAHDAGWCAKYNPIVYSVSERDLG